MFSTRFTNLNGGFTNNNLIFSKSFDVFNPYIGLLIFIAIHGMGVYYHSYSASKKMGLNILSWFSRLYSQS